MFIIGQSTVKRKSYVNVNINVLNFLHLYDIISLNRSFMGDNEYPRGSKSIIIISLIFFKNSNSLSLDTKYEDVANRVVLG